MGALPHRIRRQQWRVKAPSEDAALALRSDLRTHADVDLRRAVERAFDDFGAGDGEVIRIARLTVDLRLAPGEDGIEPLARRLHEQVLLALRHQAVPGGDHGQVTRIASAAAHRLSLQRYLATGRVEWHAVGDQDASPVEDLRAQAAELVRDGAALAHALGEHLSVRMPAALRLLAMLPDQVRRSLVDDVAAQRQPHLPAAVSGIFADLLQLSRGQGLDVFVRLWLQALLVSLQARDFTGPGEPVARALQELISNVTPAHSMLIESLRGLLTVVRPPLTVRASGDIREEPEKQAPRERLSRSAAPESVARPSPAADGDGFVAVDAGLILLHPYIPRLFDELGISPLGSRDLPGPTLPRAAALLHCLATGREEIHEFELTVGKLLLGLVPGDPLPVASGLLSAADRAEADAMLAAVSSHWPPLRNTSAAGLRESFLSRRALVDITEQGWRVRVEPRPFDLLLGQLPWSLSPVKLPWMKRPILTEWTTP